MKQQLRRVKAFISILLDGLYDVKRYYLYSQSGRSHLNERELSGRLFAKAHSIEKGLAMPQVRSFFGADALKELCSRMQQYKAAGYDIQNPVYRKGQDAIAAYLAFHLERGEDLPERLSFIRPFTDPTRDAEQRSAGVKTVTREELQSSAKGDFARLALSRHSIRTFDEKPIAREIIENAVAMAQRAPSVCNRQGGKVHVVTDTLLVHDALDIQGGNRGFGHEIKTILVVTNDLAVLRDSKERNQAFVDGGLFAMMLMLALHYLGVGSCPLNWSAGRAKDKKLRALLGIPDSEVIVVLFGIGNLKENFEVALSPRRSIKEVISWN